MDSFIRPRSCKVSINSTLSSVRSLEWSVPQGSCLGPWLYAGTLFDVIPPSISENGFADDHIAQKRFKPTSREVQVWNINELEQCAISKKCIMIFGSRQMLAKCSTDVMNIAGDNIKRERVIRYLGTFLDEYLILKDHIKRK